MFQIRYFYGIPFISKSQNFRDNLKIDGDPYYKVRPIFTQINKGGRFFAGNSKEFSIDESMVMYYGRHHTKQEHNYENFEKHRKCT